MIIDILMVVIAGLLMPFAPIALGVTAIVNLAWQRSYQRVFWVAFLIGWVSDVINNRIWGVSGAILVTLGFTIMILRQQLDVQTGGWVVVTGILGEIGWRLVTQEPLMIVPIMIQGLVCGAVWWLLKTIKPVDSVYLKP